MAKRAPILPENYNPVGERLKRVTQPPAAFIAEKDKVVELAVPLAAEELPRPRLHEREPVPEIPTGHELKRASVRFRCTLSERKKWHEITRELTADHNNLSHFIRASMLLMEHSHEQLKKLASDIQRFKKPATTDTLGIMFYEQRLSQYLYDAIKASGRPKG